MLRHRGSHLFEQVQVGSADSEDFGAIFQLNCAASGLCTAYFLDVLYVDDCRAVYSPEFLVVQTIGQEFDGFVDQRFSIIGDDHCIFVVRLEITDFLHSNKF